VGGSFLWWEVSPSLCFVSYLQCRPKCVRGRAGRGPRYAVTELGVSCSSNNSRYYRKTGGGVL